MEQSDRAVAAVVRRDVCGCVSVLRWSPDVCSQVVKRPHGVVVAEFRRDVDGRGTVWSDCRVRGIHTASW